MKENIQKLLAIVDEAAIALAELVLSHRQLTEAFLEQHGIEQAQDRIEKRRAEIQKERERIGQMRDALRHRREVEQIRKKNEKEAKSSATKQPQTETVKSLAGQPVVRRVRAAAPTATSPVVRR